VSLENALKGFVYLFTKKVIRKSDKKPCIKHMLFTKNPVQKNFKCYFYQNYYNFQGVNIVYIPFFEKGDKINTTMCKVILYF